MKGSAEATWRPSHQPGEARQIQWEKSQPLGTLASSGPVIARQRQTRPTETRSARWVEGEAMSDANKELARRYFEDIFNRRNFDVCDEILAEDYLEHAIAPFGKVEPGQVNGPQALRQTAQWLLAQFPDMRMTIEALVAEGDTVAVRVFSQGTNLGKLNGAMPPTRRSFAARQSHWFRIADNKLVEHWATREDLPVMMQLGVIPPRPGFVVRMAWSQIRRALRRH
jgi:predicted ester cyclase